MTYFKHFKIKIKNLIEIRNWDKNKKNTSNDSKNDKIK